MSIGLAGRHPRFKLSPWFRWTGFLLLFILKIVRLVEDKMSILYFDIKQIQWFHFKVSFQYSGMHKQNGNSSF